MSFKVQIIFNHPFKRHGNPPHNERVYDETFRRQALKIKEQEGLSLAKVAKRFGIGKQTVYN